MFPAYLSHWKAFYTGIAVAVCFRCISLKEGKGGAKNEAD